MFTFLWTLFMPCTLQMSSKNGEKVKSGPCGITSFFPSGMSCRGRAEAFARRLQFRLRSLSSQDNPPPEPDQPVSNNISTQPSAETSGLVTSSPTSSSTANGIAAGVHHDTDDYFDIDLASNDEKTNGHLEAYEYTRLIDRHHKSVDKKPSSSGAFNNTLQPHNNVMSNGSSSSTISSSTGNYSGENMSLDDNISLSSSDGTFFDPEIPSDPEHKSSLSLSIDYYDCDDDRSTIFNSTADPESIPMAINGLHRNELFAPTICDSDSGSESLPASQSTSLSSTFTNNTSSASNQTLQEAALLELCILSAQQYGDEIEQEKQDRISDEDTTQSTETDELLAQDPFPMMTNGDSGCVVPDDDEEGVDGIEDDAEDEQNKTDNENGRTDDDDFKPQRIRRCSSLKSGKTPPGTPGRKKFVRFADVLGLDLADVKTFMDEIPTVPKQAYQDLVVSGDPLCNDVDDLDGGSEPVPIFVSGPLLDKILVPMFQQPGGMVEFLDRVREQNVCLENAVVTDPISLTISGTVRVRNLDFNKSVHIRYSLDSWVSFADLQASYIDQSCDGFSDKFCFTIFGNSLQLGQRIEMAVRFSCKGDQFWDSNYGVNYCFQCMPGATKPIAPENPFLGGGPNGYNTGLTNGCTSTRPSSAENHGTSGTFY